MMSRQVHPSLADIALYARRDLPLGERLRIRRHLARCADCDQQMHSFCAAAEELKREALSETLTAFEAIADWNTLEREMLGNIGVGLAAARCIEKVGRKRVFLLRGAFAAGLTILFVLAWMTHIPREDTSRIFSGLTRAFIPPRQATGPVLRTSAVGITVRRDGVALTILHPPSAVLSLAGSGSVSARYVDDDTGQVTITKVYAQ
jgi:hypothetical protein